MPTGRPLGRPARCYPVSPNSTSDSARTPCCAGSPLPSLGPGLLRPLGAVLGAALAPVVDPGRVERAPHDVVPDARQILDAAAPDEDDRVLLQVVPLTRDVRGD